MRPLLLAALLAGCAAPFQPGSLHEIAPHAADRTLGCLEVSARVFAGAEAERALPDRNVSTSGCLDYERRARQTPAASTVVALRFGNRCARPVDVDLAAVEVRAVYGDGPERLLTRYDPRLEVRAGVLDPLGQGEEVFEFDAAGATAPADEVCVDLRRVAGGAADGRGGVVCFEREGEAMVPVDARSGARARRPEGGAGAGGAAEDDEEKSSRGGRR